MVDRGAIDVRILTVLIRAGEHGRTEPDIRKRVNESHRQVGESLRRMERAGYIQRFPCQRGGAVRPRAAWRITLDGRTYHGTAV